MTKELNELSTVISTRDLSEILDLSPERIRQLANLGLFPKIRHGEYQFPESVHNYFRWLRAKAYGLEIEMLEEYYCEEIAKLKKQLREHEAKVQ